MAKPIPINLAGLRDEGRYFGDTVAAAWGVPRPAPPPAHPVYGPEERSLLKRQLLLLVSGVAGVLAIVFALEFGPGLVTARLGVDRQEGFYLLVTGVYLLATTFYAAWRTQLLCSLHQAPWDARLMAFANLAVGGAVIVILGVAVLAVVAVVVAIVGALLGLGALWLSGRGGPPEG